MNDIRDSVILSFLTSSGRSRSISVPDPKPLVDLEQDLNLVNSAGAVFVADSIFDPSVGTSGAAISFSGAVHQRLETLSLF